jgi:hypothetical protein
MLDAEAAKVNTALTLACPPNGQGTSISLFWQVSSRTGCRPGTATTIHSAVTFRLSAVMEPPV